METFANRLMYLILLLPATGLWWLLLHQIAVVRQNLREEAAHIAELSERHGEPVVPAVSRNQQPALFRRLETAFLALVGYTVILYALLFHSPMFLSLARSIWRRVG